MVLSPGTETGAKVTNVQTLTAMNDRTPESVLNSPDKNTIRSIDIDANKQDLNSSATNIRSSAILQVNISCVIEIHIKFSFMISPWLEFYKSKCHFNLRHLLVMDLATKYLVPIIGY